MIVVAETESEASHYYLRSVLGKISDSIASVDEVSV